MRTLFMLLPFVLASCALAAQTLAPAGLLSDSQLRAVLTERVDKYRQSVGLVVGIIEPRGRRIVSYGTFSRENLRPVDGDTVFEIGSITKVFTSLLLADMVARGEIGLTDPVAKHLRPGVTVPERNGRHITLMDLATHMSGLPREATNFEPDLADWEAGYSEESLYEFLRTSQLTRDIGFGHEYSNVVWIRQAGRWIARREGIRHAAANLFHHAATAARPFSLRNTHQTVAGQRRGRIGTTSSGGSAGAPRYDSRERVLP